MAGGQIASVFKGNGRPRVEDEVLAKPAGR